MLESSAWNVRLPNGVSGVDDVMLLSVCIYTHTHTVYIVYTYTLFLGVCTKQQLKENESIKRGTSLEKLSVFYLDISAIWWTFVGITKLEIETHRSLCFFALVFVKNTNTSICICLYKCLYISRKINKLKINEIEIKLINDN